MIRRLMPARRGQMILYLVLLAVVVGCMVAFFGGRKLVQKAIKEQGYTKENVR